MSKIKYFFHRAIILGTGGASKAVAFVLEKLGLDVFFISRNPEGSRQFSYSEINAQMLSTCKLVINCTPVGMFPKSDYFIDIPYEFLTKEHLIIDLIYNPSETIFLKKSRFVSLSIYIIRRAIFLEFTYWVPYCVTYNVSHT